MTDKKKVVSIRVYESELDFDKIRCIKAGYVDKKGKPVYQMMIDHALEMERKRIDKK